MAKIMVVDDDDSRYSLARLLGLDGHAVFEFGCPLRAMECYEAVRPDVVLTDALMPHVDGAQLIAHFRRIDLVVCVGMTGGASEDLIARMYAAGAVEVLRKPLDIAQFYRVLHCPKII